MKIVNLNDVDFSGNGYNLCHAISRLTKHEAVSVRLRNNAFNYPTDIQTDIMNLEQVQKIVYGCDVLLIREIWRLINLYQLNMTKLKKKKVIVSLGGVGFRNEGWRKENFSFFKKWANVKWMVTSADFIKDFPEATFVPCCIPMEEYRKKYNYEKKKPPLIIYSPSHLRESTKILQDVLERLADEGSSFDFDAFYGIENKECLKRKAPASIVFDRLEFLYGVNSIEAACFESVVITYTSDETLVELEKRAEIRCPFVIVEYKYQLYDALKSLLADPQGTKELGKKCYHYAKQLHDGRYSVKQFLELIE